MLDWFKCSKVVAKSNVAATYALVGFEEIGEQQQPNKCVMKLFFLKDFCAKIKPISLFSRI